MDGEWLCLKELQELGENHHHHHEHHYHHHHHNNHNHHHHHHHDPDMSITKVTWPQLSRQHQSWSGSPIIQTILVRSPFYHHRDDDDDDDESLDDDDNQSLDDNDELELGWSI